MPSIPIEQLQHGSKVQALCERLTALAHELGAGTRLPTVIELRDRLGVSVTTLNSALIELEAKRVIERKHGIGIFVSRHLHQKSIGLVCSPEFFRAGTSPFWNQLIEGIRKRANSQNAIFRFYLAIGPNENSPVHDDLLQDIESKRLNGVIYVGYDKPAVKWLLSHHVPVVTFAGWSQWMVQIDIEAFVEEAVERLVSQGNRSIGLVNVGEPELKRDPDDMWPYCVARAFRRAMQQHALPINETQIWDGVALHEAGIDIANTHQEQGFQAAQAIFAPELTPPQALVICDDMQTRGFLVALESMGIRTGTDVQIISHLNSGSDVLRGWEDKISCIEFDPAEVVSGLFDTLEALMRGEDMAPIITIAPISFPIT